MPVRYDKDTKAEVPAWIEDYNHHHMHLSLTRVARMRYEEVSSDSAKVP